MVDRHSREGVPVIFLQGFKKADKPAITHKKDQQLN
jgi:hypothetical protein